MLGRLLELGYAAPEWSFTDSDAIADWARGHINTLCAIGALSRLRRRRYPPHPSPARTGRPQRCSA